MRMLARFVIGMPIPQSPYQRGSSADIRDSERVGRIANVKRA